MGFRGKILEIRAYYLRGDIGLQEAEDLVKPLLDKMNKRGKEIAKKYGRKHKKLTFSYVFR